MAYGDSKDLAKRTIADKVFRDKALNIAKNHKYYGYQRGLSSMLYKFFDKKSEGSGHPLSSAASQIANNKENMLMNFINQLLENLKREKCILHLEIISGVQN